MSNPSPTSSRPSILSYYHPSHHDTQLDSRLVSPRHRHPVLSVVLIVNAGTLLSVVKPGRLAHYCVMARDSDAMTRGSHVIEPHVSMRLRRRLARRSIGRGTPSHT